jgi:hypothetical protein
MKLVLVGLLAFNLASTCHPMCTGEMEFALVFEDTQDCNVIEENIERQK